MEETVKEFQAGKLYRLSRLPVEDSLYIFVIQVLVTFNPTTVLMCTLDSYGVISTHPYRPSNWIEVE
jgi:hypothetical protein